MNKLPDTKTLKELFTYEPETGIVRWKVKSAVRIKVGDIVGTKKKGYIQVQIQGTLYYLHRVIWKLHTGLEPYGLEIDHIDREPTNNRWNNLRLVDRSLNTHNRGIQRNNTTGYMGVSFKKTTGKYQAILDINKNRKHLGFYNTPEEASMVYEKKKKELINTLRL